MKTKGRQHAKHATEEQTAEWFGVTSRSVRGWSKAGCPRTPSGKYDLARVGAWLYRNAKRPGAEWAGVAAEGRARASVARARRDEIETAKLEGSLINPKDDVARERCDLYTATEARQALEAIFHGAKDDLANKPGDYVEAWITRRRDEVFREPEVGKSPAGVASVPGVAAGASCEPYPRDPETEVNSTAATAAESRR